MGRRGLNGALGVDDSAEAKWLGGIESGTDCIPGFFKGALALFLLIAWQADWERDGVVSFILLCAVSWD